MIGFLLSLALAQTPPSDGTYLSLADINGASNSNDAWTDLKNHANDQTVLEDGNGATQPSLVGNHNDPDDTVILARALVWIRDPSIDTTYAQDVEDYVMGDYNTSTADSLYGTENDCDDENGSGGVCSNGSDGLRAYRSMFSYVSAYEMIWDEEAGSGTPISSSEHDTFISWLTTLETNQWYDGRKTWENSRQVANNIGVFATASWLAIRIAKGDTANDLGDGAGSTTKIPGIRNSFRGWCGNTTYNNDFNTWGGQGSQFDWLSSSSDYVAIGPVSASFVNVTPAPSESCDGCLGEEMRRWNGNHDDPFESPIPSESYCFEALEAAYAVALMLQRCGYTPWTVQDSALERAVDWLYSETDLSEMEDNNYWMLCVAEDRYDRVDLTYGLNLSNHREGRVMIGMDWVLGY